MPRYKKGYNNIFRSFVRSLQEKEFWLPIILINLISIIIIIYKYIRFGPRFLGVYMKTYTKWWREEEKNSITRTVFPFVLFLVPFTLNSRVRASKATTTNKNLSQKNVYPIELANFRTPQQKLTMHRNDNSQIELHFLPFDNSA